MNKMKLVLSYVIGLFYMFSPSISFSYERIFYEDCEYTDHNQHFLEQGYGSSAASYWAEMKAEISLSAVSPHSGRYSMTYDPFTVGNPHAVVGLSGAVSGANTSGFHLNEHNGRYWYFRWYQRWETGISWTGSVENKLLYINYRDGGDFTFIVHRNSSNGFHIYAKDRNTYNLIFNHYANTSASLDDMNWHKLELYIDAGTTGNSNGSYWFEVDDKMIKSLTGIRYNGTIHSNPIEWLTGWPSNISGTASGTGQTWLDDLEIFVLTGPTNIPPAISGSATDNPPNAPQGFSKVN